MNFLLISTLVIASITIFPAITYGSTTTEIEEQPHALPLVAADAAQSTAGEIWQEDEREVLIRSERGAKNAGAAGGSGKREKVKRINNKKNSGERPESKEKTDSKEKIERTERPTKIEKPAKSEKREKSQKKSSSCKYEKSQWTECNQETNIRSRVLTLKKGDEGCVPTRTIQRKCKKACRYNRGDWSDCVNGSMTRKDSIRPGVDASCKPTRETTRHCNKDKKNKNKKDKTPRKTQQ